LHRITQEAITNAIRHGKAGKICIQLFEQSETYYLSVINDGRPLPDHIKPGLGLRLMQHRLDQLGGNMELCKVDDAKTRLSCRIPKAVN
jgi:signal transduction histidine kinase